MKAENLKTAHLRCFLRTDLSLVRANSMMEKKLELGNTFSIIVCCNRPATTKMERSFVGENGSPKMVNPGVSVASMIMRIKMVRGSDTMPMFNCETKVVSNTVKRKVRGRSITRLANF